MLDSYSIDQACPQPSERVVARLVIKPKRGKILIHDLTEAEALELWRQLDNVLPPVEAPAIFSQEILDEYDRDHPIGGARS